MSSSLDERTTQWCQPISESAFGGASSRYDEKYEVVLVELAKVVSFEGDTCNWGKVYSCCDELLRTKTKDMTLLGGLCIALLKQEGLQGLLAALEAYRFLVQEHSADLFPNAKRRRGRAGAYTWLTEQLIRELEQMEPDASQHESYGQTLELFRQLDDLVRVQLDELHPRVGVISRRLQELTDLTRSEPEPEPENPAPGVGLRPEPEPENPAPGESQDSEAEPQIEVFVPTAAPALTVPSTASLIPEVIEDDEQAAALLSRLTLGLRRLAAYHLERNEQRALGYQLAHFASFIGVVPDGERSVGSPSPRQLSAMRQAVDEGRWGDVVRLVPEILQDGELDLDAELHLSRALEGLGHELPMGVVTTHALAEYLLLGDMVRAGSETIKWLEGLMAPEVPAASETAPTAQGGDAVEEVIAEAEKQSARRGLEQGCAVLQQQMRQAVSRSVRFRLQLAVASICLKGGAMDLARPMLRSLQQELEEPVRSWEPGLQVEVVTRLVESTNLLLVVQGDQASHELRQEAEQLIGLLAQIDPAAAIRARQSS